MLLTGYRPVLFQYEPLPITSDVVRLPASKPAPQFILPDLLRCHLVWPLWHHTIHHPLRIVSPHGGRDLRRSTDLAGASIALAVARFAIPAVGSFRIATPPLENG